MFVLLKYYYKFGGNMSKSKMTKCKSCGQEISAKGKVTCPNCGAVNKPAVFKRPWFIILAVIVCIGIISSFSGGDDSLDQASANSIADTYNSKNDSSAVKEKIEVIEITVDELHDALDANALKAAKTYKGKYVKLTGKLSNIDSSGDYFSLTDMYNQFSFNSVSCYIDEKHIDRVMEFTEDETITVIGKITSVGEFLGYSLKVESIE